MAFDAAATDRTTGMTLQAFSLGGELTVRLYEDPDDVTSASLQSPGEVLDVANEALVMILWNARKAQELARIGRPHEDLSGLLRMVDHELTLLTRIRTILTETKEIQP